MNHLAEWAADQREVAVAGIGRSGVAATRLLLHHGIPVYLSDSQSGELQQQAAALLRQQVDSGALAIELGRHDLERISQCQALILSPGIRPESLVVRAALAGGIPVLAEVQLGLEVLNQSSVVAITGTNGKTTTTALVNHLLRQAGRSSEAVGNFGLPISEVALRSDSPKWLAAELSSFQLHDLSELHPTVGILTNLSPDHLDRYPDTTSYYADKARLFASANADSIWVSNLDDPASRRMIQSVRGRHLSFSVVEGRRAEGWLDRSRGELVLAGAPLLPRKDLHLMGDHNVANALAASLALFAVGVDRSSLAIGLRSFTPLPHRLEPIREVDGVLWINDSKATNLASAEVAIRSMTRPTVLLLGGKHKGEPYTILTSAIRDRCLAVVAYGEARELVVQDLHGVVPVVEAEGFPEVIDTARKLAPPGAAVLLSPACSSFDMFSGYDARGAAFRALVEGL